MRDDVVTDGGEADKIVANAPGDGDFFVVPKVVEYSSLGADTGAST